MRSDRRGARAHARRRIGPLLAGFLLACLAGTARGVESPAGRIAFRRLAMRWRRAELEENRTVPHLFSLEAGYADDVEITDYH